MSSKNERMMGSEMTKNYSLNYFLKLENQGVTGRGGSKQDLQFQLEASPLCQRFSSSQSPEEGKP